MIKASVVRIHRSESPVTEKYSYLRVLHFDEYLICLGTSSGLDVMDWERLSLKMDESQVLQ